jgi:hypothetical protein
MQQLWLPMGWIVLVSPRLLFMIWVGVEKILSPGLQLMQDILTSKLQKTDYKDLSLENVNKAFGKITLLRYSQPYTLSGKCAGIVVTAFGAGHTVGNLSLLNFRRYRITASLSRNSLEDQERQ